MIGKLLSATVSGGGHPRHDPAAPRPSPRSMSSPWSRRTLNNPFFDQARDGCKKAEKELGGAIECLYIGPGEHGGGEEQVQVVERPHRQEGRRHRRVALERGGDGQGAGRRQGGRHPGPHLGQRPAGRRTRPCASPMSARTITRSASTSPSWRRRSSRRAAPSASSPAVRPRPITMSACRASATRSPASQERAGAWRPAHRPERLDRGRRLPALHQ